MLNPARPRQNFLTLMQLSSQSPVPRPPDMTTFLSRGPRDAPVAQWLEPGWWRRRRGSGPSSSRRRRSSWRWSSRSGTHPGTGRQAEHPQSVLDHGQESPEEARQDQLPAHQEALPGQGPTVRGLRLPSQQQGHLQSQEARPPPDSLDEAACKLFITSPRLIIKVCALLTQHCHNYTANTILPSLDEDVSCLTSRN